MGSTKVIPDFSYEMCPKCGKVLNVLRRHSGGTNKYDCLHCRVEVAELELPTGISIFVEFDNGVNRLPSHEMELWSVPNGAIILITEDTRGDPHGGLWFAELAFVLGVIGPYAVNVSASMLASWLYEKLHQADATKLYIEREVVEIEEDKIRVIIERTFIDKSK